MLRPAGADDASGPLAVLGIDVGTSSSKGVLVGPTGAILHSVVVEHSVAHPSPGHYEMSADTWWDELCTICSELVTGATEIGVEIAAVGVSGMGPCVLLADESGVPLRPAILYGIDTRAVQEIAEITVRYTDQAIRDLGGSALSTQSVGPKLAWLTRHEPAVFGRARRLFMPSSYLVHGLTGRYILDHHSASQSDPLYDLSAGRWHEPWWDDLAGPIARPELLWPGEVAGTVSPAAARRTGLAPGIPVVAGTVDAWAEAASAGALRVGDLLLMYGSTLFLINTTERLVSDPALWTTVGVQPGSHCLAGGMAASGAITNWMNDLFGRPGYQPLITEAEASPPGSNGVLLLPYFAGERTPIMDPLARGIIAGLTLSHTRGDLYRAVLEGTGFGVRHNIDAIERAGGRVDRLIAVGGGTRGALWAQIVSDITGREQHIPRHTVGASYGAAYLAARSQWQVSIDRWNPIERVVRPDPVARGVLDPRYRWYRELYEQTKDLSHALATTTMPGKPRDMSTHSTGHADKEITLR